MAYFIYKILCNYESGVEKFRGVRVSATHMDPTHGSVEIIWSSLQLPDVSGCRDDNDHDEAAVLHRIYLI